MTFWWLFGDFFESQKPPKSQKLLTLPLNEGPRSSDKDQLAVLSILGNLGLYFIIPSNF